MRASAASESASNSFLPRRISGGWTSNPPSLRMKTSFTNRRRSILGERPARASSNPAKRFLDRLLRQLAASLYTDCGGVGERLKPAVLKTVRPERVSGVRIPPPPPEILGNEPLPPEQLPLGFRLSLGQAGVIAGTHPYPARLHWNTNRMSSSRRVAWIVGTWIFILV